MQQTKEMARMGKQMGKKVMATDTAQEVVGVMLDGLEVAVDTADDVTKNLKTGVARAGSRSPKRASAKKSAARKKTTAKKSAARKKTTAKKSAARKKTTAKKSAARKKTTAKKSAARKKTTAKSSAARKKMTSKRR
jgi:hypothetical protein